MAKVTVIVAGSALWVPRRDSWSVLFPKAVGNNPQHVPFLSYQVDDGQESQWVRIDGKCVRIVGVPSEPPVNQSLNWLHGLSSREASDVRGAPCTPKATVVGELQLPRRTLLAGTNTFVGPITDPETGIVDHYWSYASKIEFDLRESDAEVLTTSLDGTVVEPPYRLDAAARHVAIFIRNLTEREVTGDVTGTHKGEILEEMRDLFAVVGTPNRVPPIYQGPDLKPASPAESLVQSMVANPFRLCPQGYCEDCPDD